MPQVSLCAQALLDHALGQLLDNLESYPTNEEVVAAIETVLFSHNANGTLPPKDLQDRLLVLIKNKGLERTRLKSALDKICKEVFLDALTSNVLRATKSGYFRDPAVKTMRQKMRSQPYSIADLKANLASRYINSRDDRSLKIAAKL